MKKRRKDLTGKTSGRLTVIKFSHFKGGMTAWLCLCSCGNYKVVVGAKITNGHTKSCGCLARDTTSKIFKKHGMSKTYIYKAYLKMQERCSNENNNSYRNYGGRGIKVCDRWRHSFENFYADMGVRPENMSIERIDNDGDYSPGNCKWATMQEQNSNKRDSRLIEYRGVTRTLSQWARIFGIKKGTLKVRLNSGYSVRDALNLPLCVRVIHPRPH